MKASFTYTDKYMETTFYSKKIKFPTVGTIENTHISSLQCD